MIKFSIIVPCMNEEKNIEKFIIKTRSLFANKYNFKIIFIDDGSVDGTWKLIKNLKEKNSFISGIKLSRNFGKENAIECGLKNIKDEDFVITIDADLQHPLERIEDMINLWLQGYKIINTYRINSDKFFFRKFISKTFYFLINHFTNLKIQTSETDFMLLDKYVVSKYNQMNEKDKQYRSLINWMGFKKTSIPIKIDFREGGKSKYKLITLLKLAINILVSYSLYPFKFIAYLGAIMFSLSFATLLIVLIDKVFLFNSLLVSYNSIILLIQIILTGLILISVSLLAIYLNKILENTLSRPNYLIEEEID